MNQDEYEGGAGFRDEKGNYLFFCKDFWGTFWIRADSAEYLEVTPELLRKAADWMQAQTELEVGDVI